MHPNPLHHEDYTVFIRLLKKIRLEKEMTQAELARRLEIEQTYVSRIERQERRLDPAELRMWCQALDISTVDFMYRYELELLGQTKVPSHFK